MVALVEGGLRHRKEHQLAEKEDIRPETRLEYYGQVCWISIIFFSTEALVKSVKSKVSQHTKNRLKHSQAVHKKCK